MKIYKGIWENATEREWKKFCLPSEKPTIFCMVQEFYLSLKQREATRPFYELRSFVKVKGINVLEFKDLGSYTIPVEIRDIHLNSALYDLGANINLIPLSIYEKLRLGILKIPKLHYICEILIQLGRPFLATSRSTIELKNNELKLRIDGKTEIFKCSHRQNGKHRERLGRQCFEIFVNIPSYLVPGKVFFVISAGQKSKFRERNR
ncbi:DNA damage-inducible protein 1-like [Gossypium australe]|uniref:DNA damage-inducible protein 1-like n=1 Tax=Gossypium australe TaxID=47621 RepID=A0A5B6UYE5_9ROSI|nr:DNA damage-inducible protein 1-like [Gossypium australe]